MLLQMDYMYIGFLLICNGIAYVTLHFRTRPPPPPSSSSCVILPPPLIVEHKDVAMQFSVQESHSLPSNFHSVNDTVRFDRSDLVHISTEEVRPV
jgi:hypothetical protein